MPVFLIALIGVCAPGSFGIVVSANGPVHCNSVGDNVSKFAIKKFTRPFHTDEVNINVPPDVRVPVSGSLEHISAIPYLTLTVNSMCYPLALLQDGKRVYREVRLLRLLTDANNQCDIIPMLDGFTPNTNVACFTQVISDLTLYRLGVPCVIGWIVCGFNPAGS